MKQRTDPLQRIVKEAKEELEYVKREYERYEQRIDTAFAQGQGWRTKQIAKQEAPYGARIKELEEFLLNLRGTYQMKMNGEMQGGDLLVAHCFCGLFITAEERCMECGRPACMLHSQAMYDRRGRVIGRLCVDCQSEG